MRGTVTLVENGDPVDGAVILILGTGAFTFTDNGAFEFTHLSHKAEHGVDLETGAIVAVTVQDVAADGSGKMKRTPHHFASVFLRRRDGGRDGREVTGWRMDAAVAVDAKTRPPRLGHAADDVPTAPTSRFVIGLAKAWRMSIESVCYEFTR